MRAKRLCVYLDIPLVVFDFNQEFKQKVVDQYIKYYQSGRTPNPCIWCNEHIKFKLFLQRAKKEYHVDGVATGHYAQIIIKNQYHYLKTARDRKKDQTYFLYRLPQTILKQTTFPLGNFTKDQVKKIASRELAKMDFHQRPESQDLCFLPDKQSKTFLLPTQGPGPIKNCQHQTIGIHEGISHYTIGQRHGLNVSSKTGPLYITALEPRNNTVYVGQKNDVFFSQIWLNKTIIKPLLIRFDFYSAKLRSQSQPANCQVRSINKKILLDFDQPQFAPTKGQHAVVYHKNLVVGGGEIYTYSN